MTKTRFIILPLAANIQALNALDASQAPGNQVKDEEEISNLELELVGLKGSQK